MSRVLSFAAAGAALLLAAGLATSASAATPVNYAATFTISYADSAGLQIETQSDQGGTLSNSGSVAFSLTGSSHPANTTTMALFDIWTPETNFDNWGTVNDQTPEAISVDFHFTQPGVQNGVINGDTDAVFTGDWDSETGQVVWNNTPTLNFGGETLTIALGNATFDLARQDDCDRDQWDCSTTYDVADVNATFTQTLNTDPPGVPEPASWALMIGGFGMTGVMLRRRRGAVAATA